MEGYNRHCKRATTRERCARAFASPDFKPIRRLIATETRAGCFMEVLIRKGRIANYHPYPLTPWNASADEPARHLDLFPLLTNDGVVKVALSRASH